MEINNFFSLSTKLVSKTFHASAIGLTTDENNISGENRLIAGEYNKIIFPVVFKQISGNRLEDILDTGWAGLFVISDKVKCCLEANNFTGWKIFEITLLDKKGVEITGYYGFSTTGRSGKIDYRKAEVIERRLISTGPLISFFKGLPVDLESWDGTDFFLPDGNKVTIVSSKVADALKDAKITNCELKNLSEIETPDFAVRHIQ